MKNKLYLLLVFNLAFIALKAQTPNQYQPYSYHFYQKLSREVYNKNTRVHSSLKPFFIDDSLVQNSADSVLNFGITERKSWASRKLFNEHLIDVKKDDYTAYVDFLPDFMVGKDFEGDKTLWLNTRGFQVGGTVGKKFSFYTSGYENQGVFPAYLTNYINDKDVVPGQSFDRKPNDDTKDWSYVTALISYTPIKYLNVTIGQDKNFIGDGYRSMLLSDYSTNYPFLKLTAKLGDVQYMAMWAAMQDPSAKKLSYDVGNRKKGGVFHYLDWNVNNRLSVGFFDAIVWAQTDSLGNRRGFDWGYANPVIFLRPLEGMSGSPDNVMIGFTAKYELLPSLTLYGQIAIDEFESKNVFSNNGSSRNKFGFQAGIRGADLFKVQNLNYLFEVNAAKPYTYSERVSVNNYSHYNEPLAHPMGANFREFIGMMSYPVGRFDFTGQVNYAEYGLDVNGQNFGKDIFKLYTEPAKFEGNFIGQGLKTNLLFMEGKVLFTVNPKYNLRLELGGIFRQEKSVLNVPNTSMVTFGLRSSFRNIYKDF